MEASSSFFGNFSVESGIVFIFLPSSPGTPTRPASSKAFANERPRARAGLLLDHKRTLGMVVWFLV